MSAVCECKQQQTMNHVVDMCLLTESESRLQLFHSVDGDALGWLETTVTTQLVK